MSYLDPDLNSVQRDCRDFRRRCQSVQMTVQHDAGELDLGCSPFIHLDEDFHVYLNHGSALSDGLLNEGRVNLMFLEDEIHCAQTFSRRQLNIRGSVTTVPRGFHYTRIMVAFQDRLGAFMDYVRRMPNARLIRVTPIAGLYINELAQAFTFKGARMDSMESEPASVSQLLSSEKLSDSEPSAKQARAGAL